MSGTDINTLMALWAARADDGISAPYENHNHLYSTIDATPLGDAPWHSFSVHYSGETPDTPAPWMVAEYDVWCRDIKTIMENMLSNPDFDGEIDYAAKQVFEEDGQRQFRDFMPGNWAFKQSMSLTSSPGCSYLSFWFSLK